MARGSDSRLTTGNIGSGFAAGESLGCRRTDKPFPLAICRWGSFARLPLVNRANWIWQAACFAVRVIVVDVSVSPELPLLDESLTTALFARADDPQVTAMQRRIWTGIRDDLHPELTRAEVLPPAELCPALHRIRGYVATAGLLRLADHLRAWEHHATPAEIAPEYTSRGRQIADASIIALESRYPHIRTSETTED